MADNSWNTKGEFLTSAQAKQYMQNFLDCTDAIITTVDNPPIVTGQVLGLDKLETFIEAIRKYNANDANASRKIAAVRIHYARSDRRGRYPKNINDVYLVPVLETGEDLETISSESGEKEIEATDQMILGEAIPCPNLC